MECWTRLNQTVLQEQDGNGSFGFFRTRQWDVMTLSCNQVIWYLGEGGVAILLIHILDLGLGAFHRAVHNITVRLRIVVYFTCGETKGLEVK